MRSLAASLSDEELQHPSLPLWAAVPPRAAVEIAIGEVEKLDRRLEDYPPHLLELIYDYNPRWVMRAMHRGEHLGEAEAALAR